MSEGGGSLGTDLVRLGINLWGSGGGGGSAAAVSVDQQRASQALGAIVGAGGFEKFAEGKTADQLETVSDSLRLGPFDATRAAIGLSEAGIIDALVGRNVERQRELDAALRGVGVFQALPGTRGAPAPSAGRDNGGSLLGATIRASQIAQLARSLYDTIRGRQRQRVLYPQTVQFPTGGPDVPFIDTALTGLANLAQSVTPIVQAFTGQPYAQQAFYRPQPAPVPSSWTPIGQQASLPQLGLGALGALGLGSFDVPGIDLVNPIQPQGMGAAISGGACIVPRVSQSMSLPSTVEVPYTTAAGNRKTAVYKNMGRPILYSGDRACAKRYAKASGMVLRRRGGR